MEIRILDDRANPLLKRHEVRFEVAHATRATPSRDEVRGELSKLVHAPKERVVVERMAARYGTAVTRGEALVYQTVEALKATERAHILVRNGLQEKPAAAAAPAEPAKAEPPKEEAPKIEAPAPPPAHKGAPKEEAPKAEHHRTEPHKAEHPKAEAPAAHPPHKETSKDEASTAEPHKGEHHRAEAHKSKAPKGEASKGDSTKAETSEKKE